MENRGPIREARDFFELFVHKWDYRPPVPGLEDQDGVHYLQHYLLHWLDKGDAVPVTGGNFETYQRAVVEIADAVMQGEV